MVPNTPVYGPISTTVSSFAGEVSRDCRECLDEGREDASCDTKPICARRSTVSNGNLKTSSSPEAIKLQIEYAVGASIGSILNCVRSNSGAEVDMKVGMVLCRRVGTRRDVGQPHKRIARRAGSIARGDELKGVSMRLPIVSVHLMTGPKKLNLPRPYNI